MKDLKEIALSLPNQIREPVEVEWGDKIPKHPKSLVVCGMGGSGIIGDIIHALLPVIPIQVHKDYGLPMAHRTNSLFLVVSYSGNTEETLSAYRQAVEEKKDIAVITGGGELLEEVRKDGIPHIVVPHAKQIPARFSVGPCIKAALKIVEAMELIDSAEKMITPLKNLSFKEEEVAEIANAVKDSVVLVYSSEEFFGLAKVWKVVLNESAKVPAFTNIIPEALHNEIESIDSIKNPYLIFLDNPQQDNRVSGKFKDFESTAQKYGWKHKKIILSHSERIVNLVQSTILALLTGLEIAKKKGIDPVKTPFIDQLKKKS